MGAIQKMGKQGKLPAFFDRESQFQTIKDKTWLP